MLQMILGLFGQRDTLLYMGAGILALSLFAYMQSLSSKVGRLETENTRLIQINKEQAIHLDEIIELNRQNITRIKNLSDDLTVIRTENKDLRDKFIKHDVKEIAKRHPEWLENIINDGTDEVIDELNKITSTD